MDKTLVPSQSCAPAHFKSLSRRGFLSVGALAGIAGLNLADVFRMQRA